MIKMDSEKNLNKARTETDISSLVNPSCNSESPSLENFVGSYRELGFQQVTNLRGVYSRTTPYGEDVMVLNPETVCLHFPAEKRDQIFEYISRYVKSRKRTGKIASISIGVSYLVAWFAFSVWSLNKLGKGFLEYVGPLLPFALLTYGGAFFCGNRILSRVIYNIFLKSKDNRFIEGVKELSDRCVVGKEALEVGCQSE